MKRVIVIGLGIFGFNIARRLFESGFEVVAVDKNKDTLQKIRDFSTRAVLADAVDKEVMELIGIQEDDTVIVSFGDDLAASTLITLHLKQLKVKNIIVKAPNEEHKLILEKVGASEVIIPEKEMAFKVAKSLVSPNILDYLPLADGYIVCEVAPPNSFLGKTMAELQLRSRYHVEVIGIRDVLTEHMHMLPAADFVIKDGEALVVVAKETDIQKIK
ncbi:MAG: TrkA family potassium uptake protein [Desulfuromonadales bacterium]|nr:TrkA family potassium uptake protein [Desulfuromonadales bacterium]